MRVFAGRTLLGKLNLQSFLSACDPPTPNAKLNPKPTRIRSVLAGPGNEGGCALLMGFCRDGSAAFHSSGREQPTQGHKGERRDFSLVG